MRRPRVHTQPLAVLAVLLCGAILGLIPATASAESCSSSWTGAAGNDLWSDQGNWSPVGVPGTGAIVCIQAAGTYTVQLTTGASVGGLTIGNGSGGGAQTLKVDSGGGSLTLTGAAAINTTGALEVAGGVTQNDNSTTTNGGSVTIDSGGSVDLSTGDDVFVNDGSVVNNGSLVLTNGASWTQNAGGASQSGADPVEIFSSGLLDDVSGGGSFDLVDGPSVEGTIPAGQTVTLEPFPGHNSTVTLTGSTVTNDGSLVLDEPSGGGVSTLNGAATLVNNGQITAQTENGSTTNHLQVNLTNEAGGTLEVASGTLAVDGNTTVTNDGDITTASGATLIANTGDDVIVNDAAGEDTISNGGAFELTNGASFTQAGNLTGDPVEVFSSGLLADASGGGSFDLVDDPRVSGTIPAGQTVTLEPFSGHNSTVTLTGTTVTNDGTLVLDEPSGGGVSTLNGAATLVNNGQITAQTENGSTTNHLQVNLTNEPGGTLEVASGTLALDGNTTVTNDGDVTTVASATLTADTGDDQVINDAASGNAITNGGAFTLTNGATFTQAGALIGNPVEILSSGLLDDASGGGSFDLVDGPALQGTIPAGQTVTLEPFSGHNSSVTVIGTVTNYGTLVFDSPPMGGTSTLVAASAGSPEVDNFGSIVAQSESGSINHLQVALVNEPSGSVEVKSATLQDDGNKTLTNQGTLTTDPQLAENPTPTFQMTTGDDVFVNDGSVVNNGSLVLTNGASWTQNAGGASQSGADPVEIFSSGLLDDVSGGGSFDLVDGPSVEGTIPAGQTVTLEPFPGHNSTVTLTGSTVTNDGSLVLDEPSGGGVSTLNGAATLVNNGQITAQTENGSTTNHLQVNLTNEAGGTLEVASGTLAVDGNTTVTNDGDITTASGATLIANTGDDVIVNDAAGEDTISNGGAFELTNGASFTQAGNLTGDPVEVFSSGLLADASGGGSFDLVDDPRVSGTIPAGQTVTLEPFSGHNSTVTLTGTTVTNDGTLVLDEPSGGGVSTLNGAATLVNNGQITAQTENGSTTNHLQVNLTNEPGGTLEVASGTLALDGNTTTLNHGTIGVAAGAELNANTGDDVLVNESDGTLEPDLASAASFGTFSFANGATFTIGGTMLPNLVGGYTPAIGTQFEVMTGTNVGSGTFGTVANNFIGVYQAHDIIVQRDKDSTATTLGVAPGSSNFGQQVTLTATITGGEGTIGSPTGTVTFFDGGMELGTGTVSTTAGVTSATFTTSLATPLSIGTHQLTASYGGDSDFKPSASSPATPEIVSQETPAVTLAPSNQDSTYNSPVTITATVAGLAGATPQPTGTVTFMNGTTQLGTPQPVTLVGGVPTATLTTSALPGGDDQVTADYSGDTNYVAAPSSSSATVDVLSLSTSTSLLASPSPGADAGPETLTATITPSVGADPTGTVTFYSGTGEDQTVLGTEPVSTTDGTTTAQLALPLSAGTYQLVASYSGDQNFGVSSSSPPTPLTIDPNITEAPVSQTVTAPVAATFTAAATGATSVQWQVSTDGGTTWINDTADSGNATNSLTVSPTSVSQSGNEYRAVFAAGSATIATTAATLTVNAPACAADPTIATDPGNETVTAPAQATFTAAATDPVNCHVLTVQWQVLSNGGASWTNDTTDAGSTTNTLTVSPTTTSESGDEYRAVYTDENGSVDTSAATLTVQPAACPATPTIVTPPQTVGVVAPGAAPFSAAASNPAGCGTMSVQWQESVREFYGTMLAFTNIAGARSTTYTINPTSLLESGDQFRVLFTNKAGTTTSGPVTLYVNAQPTLTSITPKKGAANVCCIGIIGTKFNPVSTSAVLFGSLAARFEVLEPGLIAAWAPPQDAGAIVAITIHNGPLVSALSPSDVFEYTSGGAGTAEASDLPSDIRTGAVRVKLSGRERSILRRLMHGRRPPRVLELRG